MPVEATIPSPTEMPYLPTEINNLLQTLPFFGDIPSASFLQDISCSLHVRKYGPGDVVVKHGDKAKAMFFVFKGILIVTSDDREVELAELHSGTYFGEVATLYNVHRTANVIAKTTCTLGLLSSDDMSRYLNIYPSIDTSMRKAAQSRVRDMQQELGRLGKKLDEDIALIIEDEEDVEEDSLPYIQVAQPNRRASFLSVSIDVSTVGTLN